MDESLKTRTKARTLVAIRTGLVLLKEARANEVATYLKDCSGIHVQVPKSLKEKLEALCGELAASDDGADDAFAGIEV